METSSRKPCIVGNWKMNGSKQKNFELVEMIKRTVKDAYQDVPTLDLVLCPPAVYLEQVQTLIQDTSFKLGAQNVYCESEGAYTGEIAPEMLVDLDCLYVIIGHSERRQRFGETDKLIARKFVAAYDAGLIPILCVGETLSERKAGKTMEMVESQIRPILEIAPGDAFQRALIAYEPVWAIGTGISATPLEAQTVQAGIRALLTETVPQISQRARILYGGSVKADNAEALFKQPDIDGGLIGGASLDPQEFLLICQAAIKSMSWNK